VSRCDKLPLALILFMLAACTEPAPLPASGQARANAETAAACRQRADEVYNMRHRDTIYAPPSEVNTPFSANYQPGVQDRGLSAIFERDSMVSDCERNIGAEGDRTPEQGASPPGPGPGAAPGPVARP
jgi:predicted small lipoprotein YifL